MTKSANDVLNGVKEDHEWKHDPADLNTTGGMQRAITAQWHAIHALADYIDGITPAEADTSPSESPPDAHAYQAEPAPAA
jgi:hypothetical protein